MSITELKRTDWMRKNEILGLSFGLAAGLGLLVQIFMKASLVIILSIAIPFVIACIFYSLQKKVEVISLGIPYVIIIATFSVSLSLIFLAEADLGTIGIIFLTLILGAVHGQMRIMAVAYGLSLRRLSSKVQRRLKN